MSGLVTSPVTTCTSRFDGRHCNQQQADRGLAAQRARLYATRRTLVRHHREFARSKRWRQAGTQAAFLLDGQDNNNQQISTGHSGQKEIIKPSVDAIQEFKVVTNGYSAEFGRSSSRVVSVALKSGSNQIHGTVYEFLRNEDLDAKNFFATTKSPYKRNQFGGTHQVVRVAWLRDSTVPRICCFSFRLRKPGDPPGCQAASSG